MFRTTRLAILAAISLMIALPAGAQTVRVGPPATFAASHWTDPATGCSYVRAQAPGYAPTWHLVLNGSAIGLTDAPRGCAVWLQSS